MAATGSGAYPWGAPPDTFSQQHVDAESRTLAGVHTLYAYEATHLDRVFRSLQMWLDMGFLQQMEATHGARKHAVLTTTEEAVLAASMLAATRVTDAAVVDMRHNPVARDRVDERLGLKDNAEGFLELRERRDGRALRFFTNVDSGMARDEAPVQAFQEVVDYMYGRFEYAVHHRTRTDAALRGEKPGDTYDVTRDVLQYTPLDTQTAKRPLRKDFTLDLVLRKDTGGHWVPRTGIAVKYRTTSRDSARTGLRDYRNVLHRHVVEPLPCYKPGQREEELNLLKESWLYGKMRRMAPAAPRKPPDNFLDLLPWATHADNQPILLPWAWAVYMHGSAYAPYLTYYEAKAQARAGAGVVMQYVRADDLPTDEDRVYLFGGHHAAVVVDCLQRLLRLKTGATRWIVTPRWAIQVDAVRNAAEALLGPTGPVQLAESFAWQLAEAPFVVCYDQRVGEVARRTARDLATAHDGPGKEHVLSAAIALAYYNTSEGVPLTTHDYPVDADARLLFPRGLPVYHPMLQQFRDRLVYTPIAKDVLLSVRAAPATHVTPRKEEYTLLQRLYHAGSTVLKRVTGLGAEGSTEEPSATVVDAQESEAFFIRAAEVNKRQRDLASKPPLHTPASVVYTGDPLPLALLDHERTSTLWLSYLMRPSARAGPALMGASARAAERIDVNSMFSSRAYYAALHVDVLFGEMIMDDLLQYAWDSIRVVLANDYVQYDVALPADLMRRLTAGKNSSGARQANVYYLQPHGTPSPRLGQLMMGGAASGTGSGEDASFYRGTWPDTLTTLFFQRRSESEVQQLLQAPARRLAMYLNQALFRLPAYDGSRAIALTAWLLEHVHGSRDGLAERYGAEIAALEHAVTDHKFTSFQRMVLFHYIRVAEYTVVRWALGMLMPLLQGQSPAFTARMLLSQYVKNLGSAATWHPRNYAVPVWFLTSRMPLVLDWTPVEKLFTEAGRGLESIFIHTVQPTLEFYSVAQTAGQLSEEDRRMLGLDVLSTRFPHEKMQVRPNLLLASRAEVGKFSAAATDTYFLDIVLVQGPFVVVHRRDTALVKSPEIALSLLDSYSRSLYLDLAVAIPMSQKPNRKDVESVRVVRWRL